MSTKTSLFEAVNKNDILTVHSLVQSGACAVNLQDIDGCTPLHMAVRKSYLELTRLLLGQSDCGVNIQDNYGCTPLHEAVEQCYLEIARCILNHNDCDVNVQSRLGDTPLHLAVMNNSSDMVKCILNHNDCRVNIQNNLGSTPLHVAVFNKSIDIVRCLSTRSDLGVNLQNSKGKTPLDVAVMFNNKDIAKCILSRAALGVNIKTSIGDTPLHVAVLQNNIDNVKCLISEKDCSVNVQNKRGDTPLHLAVLNNNVDIVKCLINQNNYCGNRQNRRGDTPLHSAVLNNNADIVKCLINQKDCSGNIQNKKGYTPLHIAVLYNNKEIVKCLIHRPDCGDNIKNKRGHTPLHLAVLDNNTEIVKCLMSSSNISRDNLDYTPLHTAVKESKIEIICCLIEEGNYDINMKNEEGFSPFSTTGGLQTLHKIAKDKNVELVRVLNKHNVDVLSNHVNNQLQLVKFILSENDIESLRFLIHQNGLYINSLSSSGENIVHLFAKFYMDYLFKDFSFLLNYGLDFNLLNNDGSSPLMVASYLNNFPFIQFLASTHCDVNIQNHEGHTALHLCVIGLTLMEDKLRRIKSISVVRRLCANEYYPRYLECIDILLDLGADVDIKDKCGRTVVMLACMKNDKILLKKLILAGADVNIKDTHGRCALQYLDLKNLYDLTCINLLLSHGCRQSFNQPCLNGNTVVQNVLKFKPLLQHSVITDFIKFLVYKNVNLQVLISDDEKSPLSQLSLLRFSSESRQELRQILYLSGGPFEQITRILNFEVEENYEALLPETLKENPREKFHIFANNLSLQEICRRVIRQNIGLAIHGWITKLLDVQILADFLMFKDEDSKRFSLPEQLCSRTDDDDYDVYNIEDDYKNDYLVYEDITYLNEVQAGLEKFSKSSDLDSNSDSTSYSDLDSDLDSNSTSYSDSDLDLNSDSTSYSDFDLNSDLDSLSGLDSN